MTLQPRIPSPKRNTITAPCPGRPMVMGRAGVMGWRVEGMVRIGPADVEVCVVSLRGGGQGPFEIKNLIFS